MSMSRVQFVICGSWYWTVRNVHNKSYGICGKDIPALIKYWCPVNAKDSLRWKTTNTSHNSSITETKESGHSQLTLGERVKQTTKDASYLGIIIAGVGVTGIMFYAILRELFSGQSPNSIYTDALKLCRNDPRVVDAVGEPIKGYGELSARGRRRHVSHMEYVKDDVNYMRMKFYIEGIRKKGTVHLEMKQNEKKKYEYRYLFVDLDGYPRNTIVIEDNRNLDNNNFSLPLINL